MCEEHKHLGAKRRTSYSERDFALELANNTDDKKIEIINALKYEILAVFEANNDFRLKLSKGIGNNINIRDTNEIELLETLNTFRKENDILVNEIIEKEKIERENELKKKEKLVPKNIPTKEPKKRSTNWLGFKKG